MYLIIGDELDREDHVFDLLQQQLGEDWNLSTQNSPQIRISSKDKSGGKTINT